MKYYCCILILLASLICRAQQVDSIVKNIASKLNLSDSSSHSNLFLHIDKSIYRSNENIWFAAYLMRASNIDSQHTLFVVLVNEMDHSIASTYKFALEQGLASATFALPDSLLSGKYCLVAYTNKIAEESRSHLFRQPIDIIGLRKDPFDLQLKGANQGSQVLFTAQVTKREGTTVMPRNLSFTVYAGGKLYQKFNEQVSRSGEVKFSIPDTLATHSMEIVGTVNPGKEQMIFRRPLIWTSSSNFISFLVPGGKLLEGQPAQIAVRVRNSSGQSLSKSCILLENNVEISAFSTDKMGNGLFIFTPVMSKEYVVKFKGEKEIPVQQFPAVQVNAWRINPQNTVAKDTLSLTVSNNNASGDGIVIIHNTHSMLYSAFLKLRNKEMLLKVPVKQWEDGLVHVCIFSKEGILLQERLVLIANGETIRAVLQADAATYKPLSKVTMKVKVINAKGEPIKGIFSFSSALETAISPEYKDIEVFDRYGRFLSNDVLTPASSSLKNNQEINTFLLRLENSPENQLTNLLIIKPDDFDGYLLYNGKRPKIPVELMLVSSQINMLKTDVNGNFALPVQSLRATIGKEIMLTVLGKRQAGYRIEMNDRWSKVNEPLAKQNLAHDYFVPDELTEKEKRLFTLNNIALDEVTIRAKKSERGDFQGVANSSGVCNDMACRYNVINCSIHQLIKKPIEGQIYPVEQGRETISVIYHCQFKSKPTYVKQIAPIITFTRFTPFNPADSNLQDVLNNTTLHWQGMVETDEKGEASISFYSNARSGKFKGIIQGIAANGVFSSEVIFEVKP